MKMVRFYLIKVSFRVWVLDIRGRMTWATKCPLTESKWAMDEPRACHHRKLIRNSQQSKHMDEYQVISIVSYKSSIL